MVHSPVQAKQVHKFPSDVGLGSPARPKNKQETTIETRTRVVYLFNELLMQDPYNLEGKINNI